MRILSRGWAKRSKDGSVLVYGWTVESLTFDNGFVEQLIAQSRPVWQLPIVRFIDQWGHRIWEAAFWSAIIALLCCLR